MIRRSGVFSVALAGLLLVAGGRPPVAAESVLWTLVASPLAATTGSLTTFSLVATNEDPLAALLSSSEIGCVEVTVPANLDVRGAAVQSATTGATWFASRNGNIVTVRTSSGGDRLALLDSVRFTITAMPLSTGSIAWQAHAHRDQSCGGSSALLGVPPIVIVTGPAVTPSPSPTPLPTPVPTPVPTPASAPTTVPTTSSVPSASRSPGASATPVGTPGWDESTAPTPLPGQSPRFEPASPTPSPRADGGDHPGASATPGPGPSTEPEPSPAGTPRGPNASGTAQPGVVTPGGPGSSANARPLALGSADEAARGRPAVLSLGPLSLLGTLDLWIVPGLLYGVPGILLIAFILLQAAGAAAWLPAIRRLGGD